MKPDLRVSKALPTLVTLILLSFLAGCAVEYYPRGPWLYYPTELPAADRAVLAAQQAGKAQQCPEEFAAAEKLRNDAWDTYLACHTAEGIAMAKEATAKANALCPVKAVAPAPPPPPPAPPTVSLTATPATIQQGKCSTLTWTSSNAAQAAIDQGLGGVALSGSREVCPSSDTNYTITATGPGGTRTAATAVAVTPPPPAPKVIDRLTLHINFDFDKSVIRKADIPELEKAVAFVKKYPNAKVSVEGHTDAIGTEQYNQGLSERRAAAVKAYLVKAGAADASRIQTVGYGKSRPVADNKTAKGRFENRRVEVLILSE